MSEDQFAKLFKLLQESREEASAEHKAIRDDFSHSNQPLMLTPKKADTYF